MRITLSLTIISFTACGDSGPTTGGDAGLGDGSTNPDAGFDPMSPPVDGEGDACRFSIECGPRQICVDDSCIREERVPADELRHGNARSTVTEAEANVLPLHAAAIRPWASVLGDQNSDIPAWTDPGPSGPTIVSVPEQLECQVILIADTLQIINVEGIRCAVASYHRTGRILVASVEGDVNLAEGDGSVVWRSSLPTELDEAVRAETGLPIGLGRVTSALLLDDRALVAMTASDGEFATRMAFLEYDLATGVPRVLEVGGGECQGSCRLG